MRLKYFLTITAAAILFIGLAGVANAFHSGGVAECSGCHSMHSPAAGGSFLMVGKDQSSTCLTCHEHAGDTGPSSYHISTASADMGAGLPPKQRTPGGDFGWLRKTFNYGSDREDGATHGHNIIAVDNGYAVDPINATAPGGTFPSTQLACNSCHDPHGQYRRLPSGTIAKAGAPIWASGSYFNLAAGGTVADNEPKTNEAVGVYRLLAGAGYTKGGVTFNGVPAAKVPSTYNRREPTAATQTRAAYGHATAGGHVSWGDWCATCHSGMHSRGNYVHKVDEQLESTVAANYKQYVKSGDMTGDGINGFSSLVPFVENTADYTILASHAKNEDNLAGPDTTDRVSCLSCHRAHASGWMHALRYDMEYEFMTKNGQYVATDHPDYGTWGTRAAQQARGRTIADATAAYYDRPATEFATYQRVLCNKCHAKD